MRPGDKTVLEQVRQITGVRLGLRTWAGESETVESVQVTDTMVMVRINTFDVKVLVREDRFNRQGVRCLMITQMNGKWGVEIDVTNWNEDFEPWVFEKTGRRKTADELIADREFTQMCYRPGTGRTPLDSYDRVLDPFIRSTDKMEGYW